MGRIISVITPTYNRGKYLPNLYESLVQQTDHNFEWIIVDDGSTDDTETIIKSFATSAFCIIYRKKENGGKHTALNASHELISGDYVVIVDSDDVLLPDAIHQILEDSIKTDKDAHLCGMSYLRQWDNKENRIEDQKYIISNHIQFRINEDRGADRCEVLKTGVFKEYRFPVYNGEKFMSEGWMWTRISYKYATLYIDIPIYHCEYLEGGLTKSGRSLRMKSPKGMVENCKSFFVSEVKFNIRVKEMLLYWVYSLCDSPRRIIKRIPESGSPILSLLCFVPGVALYCNWKKKYL